MENTDEEHTDPNPSSMAEVSDHRGSMVSIPPPEMLFDASWYKRMCSMESTCRISDTLSLIETKLKDKDKVWFHHHPQFMHVFHMPRTKCHKLMGIWALAIRTAYIQDKQWWSVVNGIPIRYSIKEHALLTGLCCDELPLSKERFAEKHSLSFSFAHRYFLDTDKVDISEVREKLEGMGEDNEDIVKMALLYFIGSIIIKRKNKKRGYLDPFYLKLVNDLDLCKTFPWGTLSFNYCLEILEDKMAKRSERPEHSLNSWALPCFITPLEIFPFECIAKLKSKYRFDVPGAKSTCPRMCKMDFHKTGEKGYSLDGIYSELGTDKDIESILVPKIDERHLVAEVKEPETFHPTINNWKHVLTEQQKKICWDHLYEKDQSNRAVEVKKNTRKRKPDNLETNLEVGEDGIQRKFHRVEKAICDMRVDIEALKGQSSDEPQHRDESQPPYSPFQPPKL